MILIRKTNNQSKSSRRVIRRRRLVTENLEPRRVLAASLGWDGPGLGSADLTYHISGNAGSLSQAETAAAIQTALSAWSSVVDITFTPTPQPGLRDSIDISFTNIDGGGRTLAQAYFPDDVNPARIAGDIQFDSSEVWEIGNSLGNRAFDLVWVAAHEIGHALGLDHLHAGGSILTPFVSPGQVFAGLASTDIAAIQELYAPADGVASETTSTDNTTVNDPIEQTENNDPTDPGDTDGNPVPGDDTTVPIADGGVSDHPEDEHCRGERRDQILTLDKIQLAIDTARHNFFASIDKVVDAGQRIVHSLAHHRQLDHLDGQHSRIDSIFAELGRR